ncbi:MAG: hypothetical protein U5L07_06705 [Desulfobacterales bacterium]|nr:hypothetical protein [Desulfobacterales bacterium]
MFLNIMKDKNMKGILCEAGVAEKSSLRFYCNDTNKKKEAAIRLKGEALYVEVAFIGSEPRINVFSV